MTLTPELEGQFIWTVTTGLFPVYTRYIVTINIHESTPTISTCEFIGTAQLTANTFEITKKAG